MSASVRTLGKIGIDLAVAGGWMILNAVGLVGLALVAPAGQLPSLTPNSALILAIAVALGASGVEILRRRHFLIAIVPAALMAVASVGYGISTGRLDQMIFSMAVYSFVTAAVFSRRSDFID
jgi:hypothetical protein